MAVTDDDLSARRSQICHLAADWLAGAGDSLWVSAWATQDNDTEAVALLTQMVGQLGQEAADAFDHERWYAATALTRQIVEARSEEHTSELQSLMRISYAVFCLKKNTKKN